MGGAVSLICTIRGCGPMMGAGVLSAMRKSALAPAAGGGLVEVDDRPVFTLCFARSQNAVVSFCETPPTGRQVRWCPPIVGGAAVVRNAEFGANDGGQCVVRNVVSAGMFRRCAPMMGAGVAVRNA